MNKRTLTRKRFLAGAAAISALPLMGSHSAPACLRAGEARRIYGLRSYSIYHLTRSC